MLHFYNMHSEKVFLSEMYSAIQGEGPLVGIRQIFLRFNICDLRCVWCDTPESLTKTKYSSFEIFAGSREFQKIENPVSLSDILLGLVNLDPGLHHSVSITGGEPLVQMEALKLLLPEMKRKIKLPIYLETGGHRSNEIKEVLPYLDYISMDFKLPSSAQVGDLWEKHKFFLENVLSSSIDINLWIKIVVTDATSDSDLEKAMELIKSFDDKYKKDIEVFLQPVTRINSLKSPTDMELLRMQALMIKKYPNVRVVPQVHQLMGQK